MAEKEKAHGVDISQITVATIGEVIHVMGLGSDQKIYEWRTTETGDQKWILFA